jgi:hypothetical protein
MYIICTSCHFLIRETVCCMCDVSTQTSNVQDLQHRVHTAMCAACVFRMWCTRCSPQTCMTTSKKKYSFRIRIRFNCYVFVSGSDFCSNLGKGKEWGCNGIHTTDTGRYSSEEQKSPGMDLYRVVRHNNVCRDCFLLQ